MKSSEVVKLYLILQGHPIRGLHFDTILEQSQMDPHRLRDLLEKYHFYFTQVGDTNYFIINQHNHDKGSLYAVVDSIEKRNIQATIAKLTPFFLVAFVLATATVGFMLSAIVNKHGGYF